MPPQRGTPTKHLSEDAIRTVVRLLSTTEMTIVEIAYRFGVSRSCIQSINKKKGIRVYTGRTTFRFLITAN